MINNLESYLLDDELESIECVECKFVIDSEEPRAFHDLCNGCHEERNPLEFQEFHNR